MESVTDVKIENGALPEEDDCFYFETDHLALRGNTDYSELLKTMFVLEAQRNQGVKDFNKLVELKKEYLKDPLSYIEKLKNGTLELPTKIVPAEIPRIKWSKYTTTVPEYFMQQINPSRGDPEVHVAKKSDKTTKNWTPEEQRKLEELLVKYPPEEVEHRRIVKIANELGTRTKAQVSSRLQKYFLKLLKAGLPIPGRFPKSAAKYNQRQRRVNPAVMHGHFHRKFLKPSTFFPDTIIPVVMDETHAPGPSNSARDSPVHEPPTTTVSTQNNYLISHDYHVDKKTKPNKSATEMEVDLLKWVKEEKVLEAKKVLHQHYGYKCDLCEEDPIQGSRWHCTTCVHDSIDYCTDCILAQFYSSEPHDAHHKFLVIRNDKEVTNGPWSDSDSDCESVKSNDDDDGSSEKGEDSDGSQNNHFNDNSTTNSSS